MGKWVTVGGGVASSGNQLFCGGVRNNPILIGANAVAAGNSE